MLENILVAKVQIRSIINDQLKQIKIIYLGFDHMDLFIFSKIIIVILSQNHHYNNHILLSFYVKNSPINSIFQSATFIDDLKIIIST